MRKRFFAASLFLTFLFCFSAAAQNSENIKAARERGRDVLQTIKEELKQNYYDPHFRGIDVDAKFKTADERIKQAMSIGLVFGIIAQTLLDFDDSHTYFVPPNRKESVDYGWTMQAIGDVCYVTAVRSNSDAAAKGVKVGDVVYSIDGYEPTRENLLKIKYAYYILRPKKTVKLVLQDQNGQFREAQVMANFSDSSESAAHTVREERDKEIADRAKRRALSLPRFYDSGKGMIVVKLPQFTILEKDVDEMMAKITPNDSLILDLRGNHGGYEIILLRLVGYFFDHNIKVADLKTRKGTKELIAKSRKDKVFKGRLVVLVDSESASASEIFARVIQLEKRGIIIGDKTAGSVMRGQMFSHPYAGSIVTGYSAYGAVITVADGIMADGKSLEHTGVAPDEKILPTKTDLTLHRDPALRRAGEILGIQVDVQQARRALANSDEQTTMDIDEDENMSNDKP